jgi:ATP phosphoribosyltransferase regulatory subunit
MLTQDRWLLPEGIEEIFPGEAEKLDRLVRRLLDRFATWGYRLVMPPMVDFLDSLLVGTGHELDLQTLKLTDPVSGRLIGLRADMTPQVARIDARTAIEGLPSRLCYFGSVVHALSGHLQKSRNPIQVGAELYGHGGVSASVEVIRLMLETLSIAGVTGVHLDLGHVGIYRALAREAGLTEPQESTLFDILQRKDATDLAAFLDGVGVPKPIASMISALLDLNGSTRVIPEARVLLNGAGSAVGEALDQLSAIVQDLVERYPDVPLNVDLAELRGYEYHTGIVFAAFVPGQGREVARGGRYDDIGRVFGFARPAVGFSADLKMLAGLSSWNEPVRDDDAIFAPGVIDAELDRLIAELRGQGKIVIQSLGGEAESAEKLGCGKVLGKQDGHWRLA